MCDPKITQVPVCEFLGRPIGHMLKPRDVFQCTLFDLPCSKRNQKNSVANIGGQKIEVELFCESCTENTTRSKNEG